MRLARSTWLIVFLSAVGAQSRSVPGLERRLPLSNASEPFVEPLPLYTPQLPAPAKQKTSLSVSSHGSSSSLQTTSLSASSLDAFSSTHITPLSTPSTSKTSTTSPVSVLSAGISSLRTSFSSQSDSATSTTSLVSSAHDEAFSSQISHSSQLASSASPASALQSSTSAFTNAHHGLASLPTDMTITQASPSASIHPGISYKPWQDVPLDTATATRETSTEAVSITTARPASSLSSVTHAPSALASTEATQSANKGDLEAGPLPGNTRPPQSPGSAEDVHADSPQPSGHKSVPFNVPGMSKSPAQQQEEQQQHQQAVSVGVGVGIGVPSAALVFIVGGAYYTRRLGAHRGRPVSGYSVPLDQSEKGIWDAEASPEKERFHERVAKLLPSHLKERHSFDILTRLYDPHGRQSRQSTHTTRTDTSKVSASGLTEDGLAEGEDTDDLDFWCAGDADDALLGNMFATPRSGSPVSQLSTPATLAGRSPSPLGMPGMHTTSGAQYRPVSTGSERWPSLAELDGTPRDAQETFEVVPALDPDTRTGSPPGEWARQDALYFDIESIARGGPEGFS